jgi:hypothetical protein
VIVAAAMLLACSYFQGGAYYTQPVTNAAVDADSASYINSMTGAGNSGGFWIAAHPVEFVNVADATTPKRPVKQKVTYHRFDAPFPWADGFRIEPLSDAHGIVISSPACELYETYDTGFAGGILSAYSGARWDLNGPFVPLAPGNPSAMASGLSVYAGLVRWDEVASGKIDHALNWSAPAGTVTQWTFVLPASDTDGIVYTGSSAYQLPYGAHLRLRASFDISRFGPQSAAIARAMKTYGVYLADTAKENELYNAIAPDGADRWDASDLAALESIRISDFDVLQLGRIERVPGR